MNYFQIFQMLEKRYYFKRVVIPFLYIKKNGDKRLLFNGNKKNYSFGV